MKTLPLNCPAPASQWHLTAEQIQQFDQQGFILLPDRLPIRFLASLKDKANLIEQNAHAALKQNAQDSDHVFTCTFFQTFLNRVLHFHLHAGFDSLDVLGCPQLLSLAESLCGMDFVPTIDMLIYKHDRNQAPIPWHQDLIYQSDQYRVATVGLYLDDSNIADGALKIIPNTQDKKQDICAIVDNPPDNVVEIPVKAGDILIHNPMMVHCSGDVTGQDKRRTLYYEFRPMAQVINEETWPQKLLQRRLTLLATGLDLYRKRHPEAAQFNWRAADRHLLSGVETFESLYQDPVPFNTANFCARSFEQ